MNCLFSVLLCILLKSVSAPLWFDLTQDAKRDELKTQTNIVTENTQVRAWRVIEHVTCANLAAIYEARLKELSETDENRASLQQRFEQMNKQYESTRHELVELLEIKATQQSELLLKYEEKLLPQFIVESRPDSLHPLVQKLAKIKKRVGTAAFIDEKNGYLAQVSEAEAKIGALRRYVWLLSFFSAISRFHTVSCVLQ
jgi:hypothetical protein